MDNKMKYFSAIYKSILAVVTLFGVLDRAGVFSGDRQLYTLFSLTSISNLYIMVISLFSIKAALMPLDNASPVFSRFRSVGIMMMLAVGILYHVILLPQKIIENPDYQIFTYGNIVAHYIVPAGIIADWLIFDTKGKISKFDPLLFASVPLGYFIIASIYGFLGRNIPGKSTSYVYFFMDWNALGFAGVTIWVSKLLALILLLGYLVYFADYWLAKRHSRRSYG